MIIKKKDHGINLVLSKEEQKRNLAKKIRKNPQIFIDSLDQRISDLEIAVAAVLGGAV
jgi:hypothetical protein